MVGGGTSVSASICRDDPTSANATGTGDQVLTAYRALDDTHGIANALQLQAWLTPWPRDRTIDSKPQRWLIKRVRCVRASSVPYRRANRPSIGGWMKH